MRNNLYDFVAFMAIARTQNFRAAADELSLSPSAVSHSIKQFERDFIAMGDRRSRSSCLRAPASACAIRAENYATGSSKAQQAGLRLRHRARS